jgi:hexokinase
MDPKLLRRHTVAIDGSVYEKHPHFAVNMRLALKEIFAEKASFVKIVLAKDGSGKGAAIIAATAASGGACNVIKTDMR